MELAIINLVIGIVLLFLGRKLFWLFVGVAGFLIGMELANNYFAGPELTKLLIALAVGLAGALLAILFYKVAVALAGFIIGGYIAVDIMRYFAVSPPQSLTWLPYLIGGIIGTILILLLLDWALILLSSLAGASLIVQYSALQQLNTSLIFLGLVVLGILVQAAMLMHDRSVRV